MYVCVSNNFFGLITMRLKLVMENDLETNFFYRIAVRQSIDGISLKPIQ